MANSRRRCAQCKEYSLATEGRTQGLSFFCDMICMANFTNKARFKSHRKEVSKSVREGVAARDRWVCRSCGTSNNLHAHHVIYRSEGGTNNLNNLLTLCEQCHTMVHSNKHHYQQRCLWTIDNPGQRLGDYSEIR